MALRVRLSAGVELWEPVCVFDLAENLGVEVRFVGIASMEGMYRSGEAPLILIASERPLGRKAFTCAHELGHRVFNDGTKIDELLEGGARTGPFDPREFRADCFAGFLLMPKTAVCRAFSLRGWDPAVCTAEQAYVIAGYFGVGYTSLVHQMRYSLALLSDCRADALLKATPKALRSSILGMAVERNLIVVDQPWSGRAVDGQVGDLVLAPKGTVCDKNLAEPMAGHQKGTLLRVTKPGLARLSADGDWHAFLRVSRQDYVGRSVFRHLEDFEDE
jgi:Zn-dependent peptidase ImmA (M78 family)